MLNLSHLKEILSESDMEEYYHVTHTKNIPSIKKHGLIPQIGTRSKKLKETKGVYFFRNKEDADDAVTNWLGDEITKPHLLKVSVPKGYIKQSENEAGYEHKSIRKIHPKYITDIGKMY